MPNYLRSYVIVAGVLAVLSLLLASLLEWIYPDGLMGLTGTNIAVAIAGSLAFFMILACIWIKNAMLPAVIVMILTAGLVFAGTDSGILLTLTAMASMVLSAWLLALGVQQRYRKDFLFDIGSTTYDLATGEVSRRRYRDSMPSLTLATVSLLCPLSGSILLPFLLNTGRTPLEAAVLSFAATFLGSMLSTPSTWQQDAPA